MPDFRKTIIENLKPFKGITGDEGKLASLNKLLNDIQELGFKKLVENFCSQNDPHRANDFIFECWLCAMFSQNIEIKNLQYEPSNQSSQKSPDFRFNIGEVNFDIQAKKLHNITNEMVKELFAKECRSHLEIIEKPWFISYQISQYFTEQDINPFFSYVKTNIRNNKFIALPDLIAASRTNQYSWEKEGKVLVSFSFSKNDKLTPGISSGIIKGGEPGEDGLTLEKTEPIRSSIERLLKKSKETFFREVSDQQSNIVLMKAENSIWDIETDTMADVLYGDEGLTETHFIDGKSTLKRTRGRERLFKKGNFSNICGLISIPQTVSFAASNFEGLYFCNPFIKNIQNHPKIFKEIKFYNFWD